MRASFDFIQFETVGELRDAASATELIDSTVPEHNILLGRLVFDPYLWNKRHSGVEVPNNTPFTSTFNFSSGFVPELVVSAMRSVADAHEVIDPSPNEGEPSIEYLRMLKSEQKRLGVSLRKTLRNYDSMIAKSS
jgi:hypothetical protein